MKPVVEFKDVSKVFESKKAIDSLTFTIEPGTIAALLGPNGAGKTTAISMMLGMIRPTSGTVRLLGQDPSVPANRKQVGAMLQEVGVIDRMTVRETIDLFRSYYDSPLPRAQLLEISGLQDDEGKRASLLSGGQQRRLQFALAMAGDPRVVFLDEPTVGMDVASRRLFWEQLRTFANDGRTILLSTHYLEEADAIADRIVLMQNGRRIADGSPAELKGFASSTFVTFTAGSRLTHADVTRIPNVQDAVWSGRQVRIKTNDSDGVLRYVFLHDYDVSNIEVKAAALEDAFLSLTTSDLSTDANQGTFIIEQANTYGKESAL